MLYYLVFTVVHCLFTLLLPLATLTVLRNLYNYSNSNKTFLMSCDSYYTVICWLTPLIIVKMFVRLSWIWIIDHCSDYPVNDYTTLELDIINYVVFHLIFIFLISSISFSFGLLLGSQYNLLSRVSLGPKEVIPAVALSVCTFMVLFNQFYTLSHNMWLLNRPFLLILEPVTWSVTTSAIEYQLYSFVYCYIYFTRCVFPLIVYTYSVQFVARWSCAIAYKAGFSTNVSTLRRLLKSAIEDLHTYNHKRSDLNNYTTTLFIDGGRFSSQFRQLSYLQLPTSIMFVLGKRVHLLMLLFWLSSIFLEIFLV